MRIGLGWLVLIVALAGCQEITERNAQNVKAIQEEARWRDLRFETKKRAFEVCFQRGKYPVESAWDGSVSCR